MANEIESVYQREFHFTNKDFESIRTLVHERIGISLSDAKRNLVYSRLARRIRKLGYQSFAQYIELLKTDSEELVELTEAITTNHTFFFRENHHFELLQNDILPELMRKRADSKHLRIWSAGCSSGEEPYSIAITLAENVPKSWKIDLLATDIDTKMLAKGRNGVFPLERIENVSLTRKRSWFLKGKGSKAGYARISKHLRGMVDFQPLNFMDRWPKMAPFDIIFCRNVVIYFNKDTQRTLYARFADHLQDDGYFFAGHSESIGKVCDRFELRGKTVYRKVR